jgi:WD40 repeat protein
MRFAPLFLMPAAALAAVDYATEIQPLLGKRCGGCHAGEAKMGELSIGTFALLQRGGNHGKGVVPGKPDESPLYTYITGKSYPKMPMDGTTLADGEIALIKTWIEEGAKGPAPGSEIAPAAKALAIAVKPRGVVRPQVFALAWQPGAKVVALAGHRKVTLANAATGMAIAALEGHAGTVRNTAFSRDGKWLAAAGGICAKQGEVKIWNVEKREAAITIAGHSDCIYGLAFSPDGKLLATSSYDKLIKLWDTATGQEVRTLKDHIDAVYALAFTPDGKRLVSGSADRGVKIWDVASGKRLYTFSESLDVINTIAIDPTGKFVAAGGIDKSIRIWRMDESGGELMQSLMAHEDAILKLAWSPDGKTIVSSSSDKSIKVFSASNLTELERLSGQSDWVYGLEFSPDGKQLAAARMDGSYTVFETSQLTAAATREVATQ